TRLARSTAVLHPSHKTSQWLRLRAGWNQVSLLLQASDAGAQIGLGSELSIEEIYRWLPAQQTLAALRPNETLQPGTILGIKATAPLMRQIRGVTLGQGETPVAANGDYVAIASAERLRLDSLLLPEVPDAWIYDAGQQAWRHRFAGEVQP